MLSVGATLCLAASATEKVSMVSLEILSTRYRCLPLSISAACRRERSETLEGIERFLVVVYSRTCAASAVWKE